MPDPTGDPSPNSADKRYYSTGEVARLCNVSQQTIIRCFDAGRLAGFRVPGSRFRRISRDELLRFMRESGIPTDGLASASARVLIHEPSGSSPGTRRLDDSEEFESRRSLDKFGVGIELGRWKPHVIVLRDQADHARDILRRIRSLDGGAPLVLVLGHDALTPGDPRDGVAVLAEAAASDGGAVMESVRSLLRRARAGAAR